MAFTSNHQKMDLDMIFIQDMYLEYEDVSTAIINDSKVSALVMPAPVNMKKTYQLVSLISDIH